MLFFSPYRYRGQLYSIIYGQAIPSVIGKKSVALTLIINDMNSGKSITETAERNRVEKDLVESIYRMYSTHQGIDTAGIIDRLELRNIYSK